MDSFTIGRGACWNRGRRASPANFMRRSTTQNCWTSGRADFRIRVCYELRDGKLESTLTVDNPADRPMPFGLGTHEYFRVPLAENPAGRDDCRVFAPARRYWELQKCFRPARHRRPMARAALSTGMAYSETHLDDVFTDLQSTGGRVVCHVDDPTNRRRMVLEFDDSFRECVAFNPPHREAICLEPYTCAPDAYALRPRGIDAGLRVLQPGESFQAHVEIGGTLARTGSGTGKPLDSFQGRRLCEATALAVTGSCPRQRRFLRGSARTSRIPAGQSPRRSCRSVA